MKAETTLGLLCFGVAAVYSLLWLRDMWRVWRLERLLNKWAGR